MICTVNVQHNCAGQGCDSSDRADVYEEREKSARTVARTHHFNATDIMLNTAQMHDAVHVQRFRMAANPLDRETAIMQGAQFEVDSRKRTKAGKSAQPRARPSSAALAGQGSSLPRVAVHP